MKKLDIYKVTDSDGIISDHFMAWPLIATLEADTADEVLTLAEQNYSMDEYHWTNPY
jgi:hypothetical protein